MAKALGGLGSSSGGMGLRVARFISCYLGGHTKWRPLLQNHVAFAPEAGLDRWRGLTRKGEAGDLSGHVQFLGSELGRPHLSPLLTVIWNIRGESLEPLASLIWRERLSWNTCVPPPCSLLPVSDSPNYGSEQGITPLSDLPHFSSWFTPHTNY